MPLTRRHWIGLAAATAVGLPASFFSILSWLVARQPPSLTTDTRSRDLAEADKVPFLARYLKLRSSVEAAEFHIVYHDNGGGLVPAPSDWDVRAVMKVAPGDIAAWTADVAPPTSPDSTAYGYAPSDLGWIYELLPKTDRWKTTSKPKIYTRSATTVIVFEPEAIVCKRARVLMSGYCGAPTFPFTIPRARSIP